MPRKKKNTDFKPRVWEKIGGKQVSSCLYATMLQSEAYMDLTPNASRLYVYMKLQLYGVKPTDKPNGNENQFVFSRALWEKTYHLFTNGKQFSQYCNELISHGFIELIESGKTTRTKNIYAYSDKWKDWTQGVDFRPESIKRAADRRAAR